MSASVTRPTSSWRAWLSLDADDALGDRCPPLGDGSNSPRFSVDPLVGRLGQHELLHLADRDDEVGRPSVPFGVVVKRQLVAGGGADELVVEVVGDPALADLVGPVLGVEPGDLLAVAGGRRGRA